MTVTQRGPSNRYLDRPAPSSVAVAIGTILDKGLVIDIYVRGLLCRDRAADDRCTHRPASVDTYLRFAEAVNRLDLSETQGDLMDPITG